MMMGMGGNLEVKGEEDLMLSFSPSCKLTFSMKLSAFKGHTVFSLSLCLAAVDWKMWVFLFRNNF